MAEPLLSTFDIADQGARAMALWTIADIDEALWREMPSHRRTELQQRREQFQARVDDIDSAQALGFESVAEMRSHAVWLTEQAQHREAVRDAVEQAGPHGVIDLRHVFSSPLQRPSR